MTRRAAAVLAACSLFFAQSDVHAFLISSEIFSQSSVPVSGLQNSAPVPFEKSLVESAMAPLAEPEFKIPHSVLSQFNPMAGMQDNFQSKIYFDPSGRRVLRHEFTNKNYFEVYGNSRGAESGKIRALRFEGSQNYKFSYTQIRGSAAVRIVLSDAAQGRPYQAFQILKDGRLGKVLEVGIFQGRQFIRQRVYDYQAGTLTLHSADNVYEKRIYELKANGEAGRPVQYRNRTAAGEVIHIRFLYNDAEKTMTCIHVNGLHYAVYRLEGKQSLGSLLALGTAKSITRSGQMIPQSVIELSMLSRNNQEVPVYIFRKAGVDGYVMRERLLDGEGGMGVIGRVLRYVGEGNDLEYFYGERKGSQPATLTVLNNLTRERIRFELPEKVFNESQGRLTSYKEVHGDDLQGAVAHSLTKFFPLQYDLVFGLTGYHQILRSYEEGHTSITFLSRLLRGPPAEGVSHLESAFDSTPSSLLSSSFSTFSTSSIYKNTRKPSAPVSGRVS